MFTFLRGAFAASCFLAVVAAVGCSSSTLGNVDPSPADAAGGGIDSSVVDSSRPLPPRDAAAKDTEPDLHGNCGDVKIVCNGLCVDPTTDRNNCGACGKEYVRDILRQKLRQSAVQATANGERPKTGKWDVIPWEVELLETVAPFELCDWAGLLPPVNVFAVYEVRSTVFTTHSDGFCQQRVCGSLVGVRFHREDLHDASDVVHRDKLDETNQLVIKECADKLAPS